MWSYLHWGIWHESSLVSMWLWFKRYRPRVSFILSPQGLKSTIYMAWLRLFRSHFAVYYRGPTLFVFTRPPPLWRQIFYPPIVPLIAWQNYFSHNFITFGQWVAIVQVKMWSYFTPLSTHRSFEHNFAINVKRKLVFRRLIKGGSLPMFCVPLPSYNFMVSIKDDFYCRCSLLWETKDDDRSVESPDKAWFK